MCHTYGNDGCYKESILSVSYTHLDYGSVRDIFGYMKASALKGSFAVEAYETISELVDLDESTDGKDIDDIKFSNVSYALKIKAGFISISNILLNFTDEDLLSYISSIFALSLIHILTFGQIIINVRKYFL